MIPAERSIALALAGLLGSASLSQAAIVPFTEEFTSVAANWADNSGLNLLTPVATGGPDAGGYATTNKSLETLADQSVVLFRAQDEFNSSGHAFEGNWLAQNVGSFNVFVRHNAPTPLAYFTRFSGPGNFPGGVAVDFVPVPPNTWTQIRFDIRPANPQFVTFEGSSFDAVFSNLGHLQIGVSVPAALGADPAAFTFDIDKASITAATPEPSCLVAAMVAAIILAAGRARFAT